MDLNLNKLRQLAENATPGPWQANPFQYEVHTGSMLTSYRIDTAWDHGQLKGPAPVFAPGISMRPHPVQPDELAVQEVLYVRPEDAAYIAAISPDVVLALIEEINRLQDRGSAWP